MKVFHYSDIGLRSNNEDYICFSDYAFALCDGVGGIDNGEIASKLVCEAFIREARIYHQCEVTITLIENILTKVQSELNQLAIEQPVLNGIGTTFCAAVFTGSGLICAHTGDSRIYVIDTMEKKFWKTTDHTVSSELVQSGMMKKSKSRNLTFTNQLTRAFQAKPETKMTPPDIQKFENISSRHLIFICSDGINEVMDDFELVNILCRKNISPEDRFNHIRDKCMRYANDNNSAILIQPEIEISRVNTHEEFENIWTFLNKNNKPEKRDNQLLSKLFKNSIEALIRKITKTYHTKLQ